MLRSRRANPLPGRLGHRRPRSDSRARGCRNVQLRPFRGDPGPPGQPVLQPAAGPAPPAAAPPPEAAAAPPPEAAPDRVAGGGGGGPGAPRLLGRLGIVAAELGLLALAPRDCEFDQFGSSHAVRHALGPGSRLARGMGAWGAFVVDVPISIVVGTCWRRVLIVESVGVLCWVAEKIRECRLSRVF